MGEVLPRCTLEPLSELGCWAADLEKRCGRTCVWLLKQGERRRASSVLRRSRLLGVVGQTSCSFESLEEIRSYCFRSSSR